MTQVIQPKARDETLAQQGLAAFNRSSVQRNITLPQLEANSAIAQAIQEVFERFARGETIQVISINKEMTTQEAADWLEISRPHLVKLLEGGNIPFHKVGNQRRVRFEDLNAYHQRLREAALNELSELQQAMGLYS
jgi:excisionase family DNA binding protein